MLPRRSVWSAVVLSSAAIAAGSFFAPRAARAQEDQAQTQGQPTLNTLADDFLHYSIIGNTTLAKSSGEAIVQSNANPADVLKAFEAVQGERDPMAILGRNERTPALKDVSAKILDILEGGHRAVARDAQRIKEEIQRLGTSPRGYDIAVDRLRAAGPYAAPFFIQVLENSDQQSLQPYVVRAMIDVGRPLVQPLVAGLDSSSVGLKVTLVNVLGQIGYAQALPALKALATADNTPATIKQAAANAIARIDSRNELANTSAAQAYLNMGINYLNGVPGYKAPQADEATNPVWHWDNKLQNVVDTQVPTAIYDDVKAQQSAARSLQLNSQLADAISLWLASDMKCEIDLPQGATDPLKTAASNPALYYASAAGPVYLTPVLDLALRQHDSALALKTIQALELTANAQALGAGDEASNPLVKAMAYPDRAVRFGAAFALARAQPAKPFAGAYRVVPVLAEAVGQTGKPQAIVAEQDQEQRNKLGGELRDMGYNVAAGETLGMALDNARNAAAIDLIVIGVKDQPGQISALGQTDYRLGAAPVVVMGPTDQLPGVQGQFQNYQVLADNADAAALKQAVAKAASGNTAASVSPEAAAQYALTAIDLLGKIADNHASIYNVHDAVPALAGALKNPSEPVVAAAGNVLGSLNDKDAQQALATAALAQRDNAKVSEQLLLALASSARQTGNALDAGQVDQLMKLVTTASQADVRTAAAAALGALNLPSNKASQLIVEQAKAQ